VALYREALELGGQAFPPDHWILALFAVNLGNSLAALAGGIAGRRPAAVLITVWIDCPA